MRHFHFDRRLVRYQKLSSLAELEALEFRYENTIYLVPKEEPAANGAPAENKYAEYIWMPNESDPTPPSEDRKGFVHEISARRVLNPFSVKGIVHGVKPIPVDRTKGHWELLGAGDGDSADIEDLKRRMGVAEGGIASLEEFEGRLLAGSVFGWGPRLDAAETSIGTIFSWGPSIFGNGPDSLEGRIADSELRISSLESSVANFGPRISSLETDLSAETGRATGEEERIEGKVDAETLRAKEAESGLASDITELGETVEGVRTDLGQPGDEAKSDGSAFARIAYLSNIGLKHLKYEVWEGELPEASSKPYTILLVKKQGGVDPKNIFTEYISIETTSGWQWEKLGEAGLDLSNVVSKAELQAEAQARALGDADTLEDAKDYTDGVKEDLETAIAAGDDATLAAAKGYTDTKFAEAAVSVVNANEAPETKVPTQEMVFSGGYVAMVTDPETKKVEFYIRENKDNPLMDGAAQVPANGSYFIYGPSGAIPFQLPEGKVAGSSFDHCVKMDDSAALTLNVLPAKLRAAKKTDSITVKVYKGGDGEAAHSMDIPAAEVSTTGKTENHITVSAGEVVVVDPSRPDYKELINEGGLTPGSVQFTNLKVKVAVSEIVANGGALRVVLTIGGAEHKFDTGNLFLYRTDRPKPVIPGDGGFTATVKTSVDKYLSGVKYHGLGTVVTATLKDVENTCYYISPTETKATISASELKGGSATAKVQASDTPDVDYKLNHTANFTMGSGVVFSSATEPKLTVSCSGQSVNATSGSATVSRKAGYSGFYSLASSANTFMEDFLDETLRLKEASYSGDFSDIPWDSTSTEGLRVLGKAAGQGQLMYPSGGTGERNYLRRFRDPNADGENRISTFDITVGGLTDSYESDKVAIYCYDRKGTRFQLNRVVSGGMNVPAKPSGGKWRCAWPATADQPYTQKGLVVEVVMQSAAASKTISKITLAFNPKD